MQNIMSPWGHWNGDKKAKGPLGPPGVIHSSPSSEELTPILKIYQSGGENQGKQCVDQQDRKKKQQHDFIWFPNIYGHKNIPFLSIFAPDLAEKATESLARTQPSGLPWILNQPQLVFRSLVYKLCPIQSNPNYGPNVCIWALIYRIRQKNLKVWYLKTEL